MKRLEILRAAHERGVSLKEIAERLGISTRALSSRVNGNPTLKTLYDIADVLRCDVTDLFR